MEETFDVKVEIKSILALAKKADPYGTKAQIDADAAFWLAVTTLDHRVRAGKSVLAVGRFVRLPAKDSYAYYIVERVTKKTVKLVHVPYGNKYESNAVQDGEAELDRIQETVEWYDSIEVQFALLGERGTPNAPEA